MLASPLMARPSEFSQETADAMKSADALLKERKLKGILIGGLSESVRNPLYIYDDFRNNHKDIDILVPDISEANQIGRLENGIDWWLPKDVRLTVHYSTGPAEMNIKFWENAFGIRLAFGVDSEMTSSLAPGLYIPSKEFIIGMRRSEAFSQIDTTVTEIGSDVESKFNEKMEKMIQDEISPLIANLFGQEAPEFTAVEFDHETVSAINDRTS